MSSNTVPLAVPEDLYAEVKSTATDTHLSLADVMRQSMKLGLPKLREQLKAEHGLKPFTAAERKAAFAPDPEWDKVESAFAKAASKKLSPPDFD